MMRATFSSLILLVMAAGASGGTYSQVQAIFNQHCLACHDQKEAEGGLVLESHQLALKGGDSGPVIVPGHGEESLLIRRVLGLGDKKRMPLDSDPLKGGRTLNVNLKINADYTHYPGNTSTEQSAYTGRNTSYGYPVDVCSNAPS